MSIGVRESLAPDKDFSVVWLPGSKKEDYYAEDYKLAEILASLDSLYSQLDRIRAAIGLKTLINCPERLTSKDVWKILASSPIDKRGKRRSRGWAEWLAYRYRLSSNWYISLEVLLLTHVLPVPPDPPIGFYSPPNPGTYKDGIINLINRAPNANDLLRLPFVYANYQVSIAQLKQFIEDNKDEIRKILAKLPPKPSAGKMSRKRLVIGQIAWILKRSGDYKSWYAVTEFINSKTGFDDTFEVTQVKRMAETFAKQQKSSDV